MSDRIKLGGTEHVVMQCGNCGVYHTIPAVKYDNARREGGWWWCPNGHQRGWQKGAEHTELEKLRRERDRLTQDTARLEDEIREQQARTAAAEKKYLQARRRAAAGICPCCNRTFVNVQRHMLSKHPNIVPMEQKAKGNG